MGVTHLRRRVQGVEVFGANPEALNEAVSLYPRVTLIDPEQVAAVIVVAIHTDGRLAISHSSATDWSTLRDIGQALSSVFYQRAKDANPNRQLDAYHQNKAASALEDRNRLIALQTEKPFHCEPCGHRYKSQGALTRHQAVNPSKQPGWVGGKCEQCGEIQLPASGRSSSYCPAYKAPCPQCGGAKWREIWWTLYEPGT